MLRLRDLIIRRQVLNNARYCVLLRLNRTAVGDHVAYDAKVACRRPHGSGRAHRVILRLYDPNKPLPQRRVWVWCDCEDFQYRSEYVLAKRDSSQLKQALPQPPRETNPRYKPWICKHIVRVLGEVQRRER